MSKYAHSGRLWNVMLSAGVRHESILQRVTRASVDLSVSQVSQLSFAIADPDMSLLRSGLFKKGTTLRYHGQAFVVAVRGLEEAGGRPALTVTARSRGAQRMKKQKGALVRRDMSPTHFIGNHARYAGLRFVGQPSSRRKAVFRKGKKLGGEMESSWEAAVRYAGELGFIVFEAQDTLYFGRPRWLIDRLGGVTIRWRGQKTRGHLYQVPAMRDSDDDVSRGHTGTLTLHPDLAERLMPGRRCLLSGVGPFSGQYMASSLRMDLGGANAATVEIQTPINPERTSIEKLPERSKKKDKDDDGKKKKGGKGS